MTNSNEWWELWDDNYSIPYYYHTTTGQTEWDVPRAGNLISLTKVQQNSPVGKRMTYLIESQLHSTTKISQFSFSESSGSPESTPSSPSKKSIRSDNKSDKYFVDNGELYVKEYRESITSTRFSLKSVKVAPLPSSGGGATNLKFHGSQSDGEINDKSEHEHWNNTASSYPDEPSFLSSLSLLPRSLIESVLPAKLSIIYQNEGLPFPKLSCKYDDYSSQPTNDSSWQNPVNGECKGNDVVENSENMDCMDTNYDNGGEVERYKRFGILRLYFVRDGWEFIQLYLTFYQLGKKGVFKKVVPVENMLFFQKEKIKQPLIASDSLVKQDAIKCFKSIQRIMGDRPMKKRPYQDDQSSTHYISKFLPSTLPQSTLKSLLEIQWLLNRGILNVELRDEIYMQVLKQLTNNLDSNSVIRGWELLCVLAVTFPPSKNFEPYLFWFVKEHFDNKTNQVGVYSKHVFSRLKRIHEKGGRGKVLTLMEIKREMEAPFRPSIFGESLEFIMKLQEKTNPGLELEVPRLLPFLAHSVLELKGLISEGIFRVPGEVDQITELKLRIENNYYDITGITDPNVPASLLKFWLRDLADPLIPNEFYDQCIKNSGDIHSLKRIIQQLPEINRRVIIFVIRFLQIFSTPFVINETKMNVDNLSMVFAPNFLRCPTDSLMTVFNNAKHEQSVVRTLLTSFRPNDEADHGNCGFKFEDSWVFYSDDKTQICQIEQEVVIRELEVVESKC
ncbi:3793_t:CDS:10 [Acaulospora colombiana]|uniref:3793_t:CDS:1 n=1 Tax=Acaulospora colombiana TaxID=27376 RepID=A0ACA9K2P6_9GLOM|nr:3793_t:CDS:10 [Acaulospora colombiana]